MGSKKDKLQDNIRMDFHVHTHFSPDSIINPTDLARKSNLLGIVPAISDHNSTACHTIMRDLGAKFIPAEEIFTDCGDLIGLYLSETIKKHIQFEEALDNIRDQGGLSYIPHMYDRGRSGKYAEDSKAAKVQVVEAFNARCMNPTFNPRAEEFARCNNLPMAAGSDSHFLFEFGSTYVEFSGYGDDFEIFRDNPKELLKALNSGKTKLVTKSAPIFVRGTTKMVYLTKKLLGFRTL